ncbi:hypothetical protein CG710_015605 [Lachnotalea glycerini]|uniref:Uncharacterized protein n=1 Tax=Lachnotalea glycerini TaxID=1763509 RepID=A0A371JBV3_9FIRM|nr:hypothetical protein CG710_015605 [Lachnotalea glycerini]
MSTQNDLLDGNDSNLERLSNEVPEQSDMCLNWQDDVDNNFPYSEPDACGECDTTTSEKYLRILDFRHFERLFQFSQSDRKGKKKSISDGVNVSVVLDMVFGNTSK